MTESDRRPHPPRYSVCQSVVAPRADHTVATVDSDLDVIVGAGVGAVSLSSAALAQVGAAEVAEAVARRAMEVSSVIGVLDLLAHRSPDGLDAAARVVRDASRVGAPTLLCTTGPRRGLTIADADDAVAAVLATLAPIAAGVGVTLALEPIHPFLDFYTYVHTLRHAVDIVARVPGVKTVFDVTHLHWDRHVEDDIADLCDAIALVQLSDREHPETNGRRWVRAPYGTGIVGVEHLVRCLHRAGFDGFHEDEILLVHDPARAADAIAEARAWFVELWSEVPGGAASGQG